VGKPEPKYWKSCLGANGVASQYRFPASRDLENLIESTASTNIYKYWVNREEDGSGLLERDGECLKVSIFPRFLLSENWPHEDQVSLVKNYIAWIAPSLLSLQHLSKDERSRLEGQLNVQAVSVEHHWHLYPETVDEKILTAARVQCRLQKAQQ